VAEAAEHPRGGWDSIRDALTAGRLIVNRPAGRKWGHWRIYQAGLDNAMRGIVARVQPPAVAVADRTESPT
jgi:hypothetical protein